MTQTKFVLSKALARGLKPIVVFNKMDRDTIRIDEVENEVCASLILVYVKNNKDKPYSPNDLQVFDLFVNLNASDEQLDYATLYASAREGWAVNNRKDDKKDMSALFETILGRGTSSFSIDLTQTLVSLSV